jgi:ABC-type uncharacterized transport system substrate-binding protein
MKRREFITLLGGAAAAWPLAARAQQVALIAFLHGGDSEQFDHLLAAFRVGLKDMGFEAPRNIAITYRWAESRNERLPGLARELAALNPAVFVTAGGDFSAEAAKAAGGNIPVVFVSGGDPVRSGLVTSMNRPGGNATGITVLTTSLEPKRLELLREIAPRTGTLGALVNPTRFDAETQARDVSEAARALGLPLEMLHASNDAEVESVFASLAQKGVGALLVGSDVFFYRRRQKLVLLAAHYRIPAIYQWREFALAGGLMSYGTNLADAYRQVGIYAGRILRGAKPADLPVQQSTKIELVINLNSAKALGLDVPLPLLMRVDEVIE